MLSIYGYTVVRRHGSHVRLYSERFQHSITIPDHDPIKVGTLSAILSDIGSATGEDKDTLIRAL